MTQYDDYIQSDEWDIRRKERLAIDEYTCQDCGVTGVSLDVHHLTYDRLGNEPMYDLLSLCRQCHNIEHGLEAREYGICQTCGEYLMIVIKKIKVLGVKWVDYICQDGHFWSHKNDE